GPGIAKAQRERVMQPFERGAASNRPGSGLGLAIADAIMRFHDGSLELADNGPGLAVRLRFPLVSSGAATF
ncbi:ATP-binding protein, partial [Microbacterium sp. KNMS]